MRPAILFPLYVDVTELKGVGSRLAKLIGKAAGYKVADLLWHAPTGLIDRRHSPKIAQARPGDIATLHVTVDTHEPPGRPRAPYKVRVHDETGFLTLVFFHPRKEYLQSILPQGAVRHVSGTVEEFSGGWQMTHPDFVLTAEELAVTPLIAPVYPLTAGLTPKVMAKAVAGALERAPELPEWQDPPFLKQQGWPGWRAALEALHHPQSEADLEPASPARARLAFDELLANQLALAMMRAHAKAQPGRTLTPTGTVSARIKAALPFSLTGAQTRSIAEILAEMAAPVRMLRLLQGDVGAGKTVVALFAMAAAVEAGTQAAMMAPTEILARQHHAGLTPLAEAAGLRLALLTGRDKRAERTRIMTALAAGDIDILVGTHALFQDDVAFRDLGLAVVDEQHRFGVHQRWTLGRKGAAVDMLVMTATPIPRTLTLTAYGDMAVSRLDEKPPGRKPVATRAVPLGRVDDVIAHLAQSVTEGRQAYWVCPLVEESETLDVTAAEERFQVLTEALGEGHVGLVHGRLKASEKDAVMAAFKDGALKVLVATTVIEVGVDVPNASIMIIEHAERFGLAQLHQLRGRVGRGAAASSCLLLYGPAIGETGRARLKIMRETEDGFVIAEEDLRLRGAGDLLGTRQSGLPHFRLADLDAHKDLLDVARQYAELCLTRDPELRSPQGEALRILLYLFGRDEAVRYLRSG